MDTQDHRGDDQQHLSGLVEHVIFHNEDTGFAVLRVKARGYRDEVCVTGILPTVSPGEWLEADGRWVVDARYGQQFQAANIRTAAPDTLEGIEKYLASGLIRGIGPVYAKKLVQKFGRRVFDVIEKQSALLETVDGIGPVRRLNIRKAWESQKQVRQIMTFLFSQGVSTSRAFRIYKEYGEAAIEKIRMDPYCLARDIHGIGFQTADKIARSLGVAEDSLLRATAGLEYILLERAEEGHCAYPRDQLIRAAADELGIPHARLGQALETLLKDERVVSRYAPDGSLLVALRQLDFEEEAVARRLQQLIGTPVASIPGDLARVAAAASEAVGISLDSEQQNALRTALSSKVTVITGGPGVGKTTLIRALTHAFESMSLRVALCAPTGRAAKRMQEATGREAKTIHRLLQFDPARRQFRYHARNPLPTDVLIADECSMLDISLAFHLLEAVAPGTRVIWVGDADQLPSVGPGNVLRDVIESGVVPVCHLRTVYRQAAQSAIVRNAHRVNAGLLPEYPTRKESTRSGWNFFFVEESDARKCANRVLHLVSQVLPSKFGLNPLQDIQVLSPMQKGELGVRQLNIELQRALNPRCEGIERFGYTYRVGDKVMQIENDYEKDVYNGDIGTISEIRPDERLLVVRFEDREVEYDFLELDELVLAYAVTIHKSQGSEYPCVVMPLHTQHYVMLERNLLYTGITRGKKLVVIVGHRKALEIAVRRHSAHRRITTLRQRLESLVSHVPKVGT